MNGGRFVCARAGARSGQAVPDAIEDVFSITGRGTVVTGKVEQGIIHTGDEVEIIGSARPRRRCALASRCSARSSTRVAPATTSARSSGARRRKTSSAARSSPSGQHHAAHPVRGSDLRVDEGGGGRHKPFFSNYRPQFYFRTTDVTGAITLPEGTEMCMPGDNTPITAELIAPIAMDEGLRFAIREGGRTVAPAESPRSSSNPRGDRTRRPERE